MTLTNNTLLRGYLAHLQALARHRSRLIGEAIDHPDATPESKSKLGAPDEIREAWESLTRDLAKVIDVALVPFERLASSPSPIVRGSSQMSPDPLRITLKALKLLADKKRRSDPSITLLKSWDIKAKEIAEVSDE